MIISSKGGSVYKNINGSFISSKPTFHINNYVNYRKFVGSMMVPKPSSSAFLLLRLLCELMKENVERIECFLERCFVV
jgi:hypothetical protein